MIPIYVSIAGAGQGGKTTLWASFHKQVLLDKERFEILQGALTLEKLEQDIIPGDYKSSTVTRNFFSFRVNDAGIERRYYLTSVPGQIFQKKANGEIAADNMRYNYLLDTLQQSEIIIILFDLEPKRKHQNDPIVTYEDQARLIYMILNDLARSQQRKHLILCFNKYDLLPEEVRTDPTRFNNIIAKIRENIQKIAIRLGYSFHPNTFITIADEKIAREKNMLEYHQNALDLFEEVLSLGIKNRQALA